MNAKSNRKSGRKSNRKSARKSNRKSGNQNKSTIRYDRSDYRRNENSRLHQSRRRENYRKRMERNFIAREAKKTSPLLQKLTFMQVVALLFLTGLLLFLFAFVRSVSTVGNAGLEISVAMLASMLLGLSGIILSMYGHRYIKVAGGIPYQAGVIGCGILVAANFTIFIAGFLP